jgi:TetR/AcrR family transcriptional regulator
MEGKSDGLITPMVNNLPPAPSSRPTSTGAPRKRRGRGRPKAAAAENVREKILEVARELFLRYGYRGVSSRQIGAAAGVNFAMIRYYFGGKPGLYREILNRVLQPARVALEAMAADRRPIELSQVFANITQTWAANPWIAGFIVREVLVPDGPMRAMFLREFPERLVPIIERLVQSEIERGRLRPGIDPRLLVLSMLSLAIFPFLGYPVTSRTFGVRNDADFVDRFLRHTLEVLAHGIGVGAMKAGV